MEDNMENNMKNKSVKSAGAQSADRVLALLSLVGEQDAPVTVPTLCKLSGLNRTTVWRLLTALENNGFVEQDPVSKGYQLGFAATKLGANITKRYAPLMRYLRPVMEKLCQQTQETVILSVPRFSGLLTIDQIDSPQTICLKNYVEDVAPMYCSSNGRVMLAYLPDEEVEAILAEPLEKRTPKTVVDTDQIREMIRLTKDRGFGIVQGEYDESENGISAPVLNNNYPIAVITVAGPSFRFTEEVMLEAASTLMQACREVSDNMAKQ